MRLSQKLQDLFIIQMGKRYAHFVIKQISEVVVKDAHFGSAIFAYKNQKKIKQRFNRDLISYTYNIENKRYYFLIQFIYIIISYIKFNYNQLNLSVY